MESMSKTSQSQAGEAQTHKFPSGSFRKLVGSIDLQEGQDLKQHFTVEHGGKPTSLDNSDITMRIWDCGAPVVEHTMHILPGLPEGEFVMWIVADELPLDYEDKMLVYDVRVLWPSGGHSYIAKGLIKTSPLCAAH